MLVAVVAGLAAFAGSAGGVVAAWRWYVHPRFTKALRARRLVPMTTETATTRGFVQHDTPVVVGKAKFNRSRRL